MFERVICLAVGYCFGLFQTGYIYGRTQNIDLRNYGSGNSGTTNALRVMGKKAGALVFLGDFFKAIIAVELMEILFSGNQSRPFWGSTRASAWCWGTTSRSTLSLRAERASPPWPASWPPSTSAWRWSAWSFSWPLWPLRATCPSAPFSWSSPSLPAASISAAGAITASPRAICGSSTSWCLCCGHGDLASPDRILDECGTDGE